MNPVEELEESKQAAAQEKRDAEHMLWHQWNENGRKPKHLEPLLQAFEPTVRGKIRDWKAPRVNESAFRAELHTHMIKQFESYKPDRGASLRTWVENGIKKAMRYNAKNQNFAYIPEEPARFIGPIKKAKEELQEDLGRDPTHAEIAAHMNHMGSKTRMTAKKVGDIISFQREDLPSSGLPFDPNPHTGNREQEVLSLIQAELPAVFPHPDERAVFEHIYGINGKPQISGTNDLAKKLGKSPSQISRIKSSVGNKVKSYI
jgi:DNA-directed RNA polymerase specialized sigma subunit